MAQKRMFDKRVVSSDKFMDLPHSSKALYFMAGMEADDKGFFQPRKIQRMCGFTDDDFKILISKGYFITFESGVMVVTDWNKNNWLDSRRVTETEYIDELNMLKLINDKYEYLNEKTIAKQMLSENSIVENSIVENNIYCRNENKKNDEQEHLEKFTKLVIDYLNSKAMTKFSPYTKSTIKLIKARIDDSKRLVKEGKRSKEYSLDDFITVIDNMTNKWKNSHMEMYLRPSTLFAECHFDEYLSFKEEKQDKPIWFDKKIEKKEITDSEKMQLNNRMEKYK